MRRWVPRSAATGWHRRLERGGRRAGGSDRSGRHGRLGRGRHAGRYRLAPRPGRPVTARPHPHARAASPRARAAASRRPANSPTPRRATFSTPRLAACARRKARSASTRLTTSWIATGSITPGAGRLLRRRGAGRRQSVDGRVAPRRPDQLRVHPVARPPRHVGAEPRGGRSERRHAVRRRRAPWADVVPRDPGRRTRGARSRARRREPCRPRRRRVLAADARRRLVWLRDGDDQAIAPGDLPDHLALDAGFSNDTYRSLAYFVRDVGFQKPATPVPFLEFYWARWMRRQINLKIYELSDLTSYLAAVKTSATAIVGLGDGDDVSGRTAGALGRLSGFQHRRIHEAERVDQRFETREDCLRAPLPRRQRPARNPVRRRAAGRSRGRRAVGPAPHAAGAQLRPGVLQARPLRSTKDVDAGGFNKRFDDWCEANGQDRPRRSAPERASTRLPRSRVPSGSGPRPPRRSRR